MARHWHGLHHVQAVAVKDKGATGTMGQTVDEWGRRTSSLLEAQEAGSQE